MTCSVMYAYFKESIKQFALLMTNLITIFLVKAIKFKYDKIVQY